MQVNTPTFIAPKQRIWSNFTKLAFLKEEHTSQEDSMCFLVQSLGCNSRLLLVSVIRMIPQLSLEY